MGQAISLLFAVLLLGGGPIVADAPDSDAIEADIETGVADVRVATNGGSGESSAALSPENATDDHVRANVTAGSAYAEVGATPSEGELDVSTTRVTMQVDLGDGQLTDLTYTPPGPAHVVPDIPEPPVTSEDPETEEAEMTQASPDEESTDLVWAVAPATGLAAAAAVSQATPVGRWLRRLLGAVPLAPLYSRISQQDVLDHETRQAIYELLEEETGLSLESIAEKLDLARSTARHHVRKLEEANMIEHASVGRARIHHVVGERGRALREHLLSNETRASVFETIEDRSLTITEIAEQIDANPGSVHFHLEKLEEQGLARTTDEKGRRYRATPPDQQDAIFEPAS